MTADKPAKRSRGSDVRILVASIPKSGSTWLRRILTMYTFMPYARLAPAVARREQELDPDFGRGFVNGFIAQQHVRAHKGTEATLRHLGITPVVLFRDVFDHLVSLRDHLEQRGTHISTAHVDETFLSLSDDEKFDFLISFHLPWVFSFLASWAESPMKPMLLTYEQLHRDTFGTVSRILDAVGIELDEAVLEGAIGNSNRADYETLKNKMEIGRGAVVGPEQRARVEQMARYYRHLPLHLIGL